MADISQEGHERTEEATDERRQDFRERGEVLLSRELTSVLVLFGSMIFLTYGTYGIFSSLKAFTRWIFENIQRDVSSETEVLSFFSLVWKTFLKTVVPICSVGAFVAIFSTFLQTQWNFSWSRISFDVSRLNLMSGLTRIFSFQGFFELCKSIAKLILIGSVAYLVLHSERGRMAGMIHLSITESSFYLFKNLKTLAWSIVIVMMFISSADYFYQYFVLEKRLKMTKQEVKEDYKKREVDPHVKQRMRKMQKDFITKKTIESTKKATVIITNPTHYAIAIQYQLGMRAPKVLAKGVDYVALKMREIAKEQDIPIVENKPLAQSLYKTVKEEQDVPEQFYQALSEIIRFVFQVKGIKISRQKR